jgi:ribosome-binding factor A
MPNPRRRERLNALIEEVLSELIHREMKDPRIASMTSVAGVEVTKDGRIARARVSVMGSEEEKQATMKALERATGFLRSKLGEQLTIRHIPELQFVLDRSIERGDRVLELLSRLEIPKDAPEEPGASEAKAGT